MPTSIKHLRNAKRLSKNAYAPYSKFKVGSVVIGGSGKIYGGCNVENASYGSTICAERTAITQAISHGERTLRAVYIVNSTGRPCAPCGMCLQVMAEFSKDLVIYTANNTLKRVEKLHLSELLTWTYDKSFLDKGLARS
ncbi:MAG: cytidine deaminase [Oligoflexia bacterium]|nr:cytidine deaminase [Oligoflexia bacterium]